MKNSPAQSKILSQIKDGKLYNKKMVLTVEHLFKQNHSKISRTKIRQAISSLNNQGKILVKDNKIVPEENFFVGVFKTRKFGGVVTLQENGVEKEFNVSSSDFKKIPNNTVVGFLLNTKEEKQTAHIAKIVSFNQNSLFGVVRYNKNKQLIFVPDFNPFNAKFVLENNQLAALAEGKKCKVSIKNSSSSNDKFFVSVEDEKDIFGPWLSPLANIDAVLDEEGVRTVFPAEVLKEASKLPTFVSNQDLFERKDYRHLDFITIDPATAKDMDDAVYLEKFKNKNNEINYKYYVAIADITHYIKEESEIDKEAENRGFSIYAAGGVTPMLPQTLSNNICSLLPNQDRLALVTEITFDEMGNMLDYSFFNGVINSRQKMSYEFVQEIRDGKIVLDNSQKNITEMIDNMYDLTEKIEVLSKQKGTVSLSGYQPTVILSDDKNDVLDFVNKNSIPSTVLIEKAMVANNVAVAKFLKELGIPIISRGHQEPNERRFEEYVNYMSFLGIDISYLEPTAQNYSLISDLIKGHYLEKIMGSRLIRSMQKAKYTSEIEASHFALAEENYTHFTAGIRRYVDITLHRTLKKALTLYNHAIEKNQLDKNLPFSKNTKLFASLYKEELAKIANAEKLATLAHHLNEREERANKIEAKTNAICAALYMKKQLGKTFSAYVSSVEKDFVIATLKNEEDPAHSDIIDVILPLKDLIKNKVAYVDVKTHTINERKTSKVLYHEGKKINITISEIDLVEGKVFGKDSLLKAFEEAKDKANLKSDYDKSKTNFEK